ncbi:MAG: hypothetical protein QOI30_3703 [Mycobacterium sp.]|jgi:hypothetical protein|nr:hypothetical protein [Mycobacterium sp.]
MQLTFDADVEAFRAEFVAFLDASILAEVAQRRANRALVRVRVWLLRLKLHQSRRKSLGA